MWQLESERLYIEQLSLDDAQFILELLNTEGWLQHIGDRQVKSIGESKSYIENGPLEDYKKNAQGLMLVKHKESQEKIGICGLLQRTYLDGPDIGYALLPRFEGQGFITEACQTTMMWYYQNMYIDRYYAIVSPSNHKSIMVLLRLGFVYNRLIDRDENYLKLYDYNYQQKSTLKSQISTKLL